MKTVYYGYNETATIADLSHFENVPDPDGFYFGFNNNGFEMIPFSDINVRTRWIRADGANREAQSPAQAYMFMAAILATDGFDEFDEIIKWNLADIMANYSYIHLD